MYIWIQFSLLLVITTLCIYIMFGVKTTHRATHGDKMTETDLNACMHTHMEVRGQTLHGAAQRLACTQSEWAFCLFRLHISSYVALCV